MGRDVTQRNVVDPVPTTNYCGVNRPSFDSQADFLLCAPQSRGVFTLVIKERDALDEGERQRGSVKGEKRNCMDHASS